MSLLEHYFRDLTAEPTDEPTTPTTSPEISYALSGQLQLSEDNWLSLTVPNAIVRGLFDAMTEPGIELPPRSSGQGLNAHISVLRPEEIREIGGGHKITERGHSFHYTLGPLRSTQPSGWADMSRVWFVEVRSPQLEKLRRSYGLTSLPNKNRFAFHITVAVRRRKVLHQGSEVVKTSDANGDIAAAEEATNTEPTKSQRDAGNYTKGSVTLHGLEVKIENPVGSVRRGTTREGKPWQTTMKDTYGYFVPLSGNKGKDGDAVDCFLGEDWVSEVAFVIDQVQPGTGQFDEHKVMLGYPNEEAAQKAYLDNYQAGWKGLDKITAVTLPQLRMWLAEGDHTKPLQGQMTKFADVPPIYQRAIRSQIMSPTWMTGRSLFGNLGANIAGVQQRGEALARQAYTGAEMTEAMNGGHDPAQLAQQLSGDAPDPVTNPIDQFLFVPRLP